MSDSDYRRSAHDVPFTQAGIGMDMRRVMVCSHKASTTGATYHRGLRMYIRCAACTVAHQAQKAQP